MIKNFNIASTAEISNLQLKQIVKGIAKIAKHKRDSAKKELDQKIKEEVKNAAIRFNHLIQIKDFNKFYDK